MPVNKPSRHSAFKPSIQEQHRFSYVQKKVPDPNATTTSLRKPHVAEEKKSAQKYFSPTSISLAAAWKQSEKSKQRCAESHAAASRGSSFCSHFSWRTSSAKAVFFHCPEEWFWPKHINAVSLSCSTEAHPGRCSEAPLQAPVMTRQLQFILCFSKRRDNTAVFPELCCINPKCTKRRLPTWHVCSTLPPGTHWKSSGLPRLAF